MDRVSAPDTVRRLVETFDRNRAACRSPVCSETQLRGDFLDPLFESLGWDVASKKGYDQRCREVVHEDAIKVGGTTKAPDYCFRIGGGGPLLACRSHLTSIWVGYVRRR